MMVSEKVDQKIKDLNEIRGIYKRDFEEIKKKYEDGEVSKDYFEKKKKKYDKKLSDIREKIHTLELSHDDK
ncbi:MAG: hypothetical protein R6U21_08360 [Thermoplasmatota archaeon]